MSTEVVLGHDIDRKTCVLKLEQLSCATCNPTKYKILYFPALFYRQNENNSIGNSIIPATESKL